MWIIIFDQGSSDFVNASQGPFVWSQFHYKPGFYPYLDSEELHSHKQADNTVSSERVLFLTTKFPQVTDEATSNGMKPEKIKTRPIQLLSWLLTLSADNFFWYHIWIIWKLFKPKLRIYILILWPLPPSLPHLWWYWASDLPWYCQNPYDLCVQVSNYILIGSIRIVRYSENEKRKFSESLVALEAIVSEAINYVWHSNFSFYLRNI